jgi:hypothetical protein
MNYFLRKKTGIKNIGQTTSAYGKYNSYILVAMTTIMNE